MKKNIYIERLAKEWMQHGRIILAIDFDNTIYPYETLDNKDDMNKAIGIIKEAQNVGTYNVIFTASNKERHPEILAYCKEKGINVDSINTNPIELPYGKEGKIYYNINICDRSGMNEALDTLEAAMYLQRAHLNAVRHAGQTEIG